jgi:uncharacterized protein YozE (UPF0346 family)
MKFNTWLKEFKDVDRPIGDLAKDILGDKNFPNTSDHDAILSYLESHGAIPDAIDTFEYVYRFYKEDTKPTLEERIRNTIRKNI